MGRRFRLHRRELRRGLGRRRWTRDHGEFGELEADPAQPRDADLGGADHPLLLDRPAQPAGLVVALVRHLVVALRDEAVVGRGTVPKLLAALGVADVVGVCPVVPVLALLDPEVRPVDDRYLAIAAVGFEDDHVARAVERPVAGFRPRLSGDDARLRVGGVGDEPVVVGDEDEVVRLHVRLHAPALDGDHRGPDAADGEQEQSHEKHRADADEKLPDDRGAAVIDRPEPSQPAPGGPGALAFVRSSVAVRRPVVRRP